MPEKSPVKVIGISRSDWFFYIITGLLIIGLKLAWRNVPPTEPWIFLTPLVKILTFITGSSFIHQATGFWNPILGVSITKDCAGMNYFLIAHSLLVISNIRFFSGRVKTPAYFVFFISAYLFTVIANVSRVLITINLGQPGMIPAVLDGKPHLILGTFIYFFFLLTCNGLATLVSRRFTRTE